MKKESMKEEPGRIELMLFNGKVAQRADYLESSTVQELIQEARQEGMKEAVRPKPTSVLRKLVQMGW